MIALLFIFSLCPFFCAGEESLFISFDRLSMLEYPQEVSMRGFLYQTDDRWILASEPNLKSCCIGSLHKSSTQIALSGTYEIALINRAVTIQGVLTKNPKKEGAGYIFENERIVTKNPKNHFWLLLGLVLFLGLIAKKVYSRSTKNKQDKTG